MMNVVGLCLVLISLVASGVFSPTPAGTKKNSLVREEHRVIVVEYDKVIEYQHDHKPKLAKSFSALSSHGKPSVPGFPTYWETHAITPANLLCHALGVCTSKVVDTFDRAKHGLKRAGENVAEKAHEMKESTKESLGKAKKFAEDSSQSVKECAEGSVDKVKEIAAQTARHVKESAGDAWGKAKESVEQKAHGAKESAKEFLEEQKEKLTQKVLHDVKESAGDAWGEAKESVKKKAHGAKESAKEFLEEEPGRLTQKVLHDAKESAGESWRKAKESVEQKAHDARESAKELLEKGKERASQEVHDVKESPKESLYRAAHYLKQPFEIAKGRETVYKAVRHDIAGNATNAIIYVAKKVKDEAHRLGGGIRYLGIREIPSSLMVAVNLLGFSMAYGMCVWITFISSYVLAMALPRQQLGVVQSRIYPVYFRAMAASITAALLGQLLGLGKKCMSNEAEILQGYNLLAALLMVLFNATFLEPRASKVVFERMRLEREEGIEREHGVPEPTRQNENEISPVTDCAAQTTATRNRKSREEERTIVLKIVRVKKRLKKLNSHSSFVNILTLMALTWHLVYLSQRLNMTC